MDFNVYKGGQGTGLATVIDSSKAAAVQAEYDKLMYLERQKKEDEAIKQREAFVGKLTAYNPEFFYRHNQEKAAALNKVRDLGIKALEAGISNPEVSTHPAAVAYQKALVEAEQMAKASKTIAESYAKTQSQLTDRTADYFDQSALADAAAFYDAPLSQHVSSPRALPTLYKRKPLEDLTADAYAISDRLGKIANGAEIDEAAKLEAAKMYLSDPEKGDERMLSVQSAMASLTPTEMSKIQEEATRAGINPAAYYFYNSYVSPSTVKMAPFDIEANLAKYAVSESTYTYGGAEATSTSVRKADLQRDLRRNAENIVSAIYPAQLKDAAARLGINQGPTESDAEFRKRLINEVERRIPVKRAATSFVVDKAAKAKSDSEKSLNASANVYLRDITSQVPERRAAAAKWFKGKTLKGGLIALDAQLNGDQLTITVGKDPKLVATNADAQESADRLANEVSANNKTYDSQTATTTMTFDLSKQGAETNSVVGLYRSVAENSNTMYLDLSGAKSSFEDVFLKDKTPSSTTKAESLLKVDIGN